MKAVQISRPGGAFEVVERDIPKPGPGQVRIRVQACGVCHSDVIVKEGLMPNLSYPRVPGHEVAGVIDELGAGVTGWKKGERVGVGWFGGMDGTCVSCRRGDFVNCDNGLVCGISYDGGYQEQMVAPATALARIPESLDAPEAAPLMCAGVTTFNAIRQADARAGSLLAIQGLGGLGHLGVQFAAKLGYRVAVVGRGAGNRALAKRLGADVYFDSAAGDAAAELRKLGGATLIIATAPNGKAQASLIPGLGPNGVLMVVGAGQDALEFPAAALIFGKKRLQGAWSGLPTDSEDTLHFAAATGVRAMIEKMPLAKAADAYERMMSGKAEFRVVLTM